MKLLYAMIFAAMPLMAGAQSITDTQKKMERQFDDVAAMILGYGTGGAIDLAALQNMVAMERADARARAMRRLQGADLNGDGAIGGDEMRIKAAAMAAAARGRMIQYFGRADLDGDDTVSVAELQDYANSIAVQTFGEDKAANVLSMMGFDKNGDGRVTLAEAREIIGLASSRQIPSKVDQKLKI